MPSHALSRLWLRTSRAYSPSCSIRSACVPLSCARPSASATTRSASRTVDSRCAMTIVVRPLRSAGQRGLHRGLAFGVQRAGRLVQQQDARIAQQRPSQRNALPLPAGKALATRDRPRSHTPAAARR